MRDGVKKKLAVPVDLEQELGAAGHSNTDLKRHDRSVADNAAPPPGCTRAGSTSAVHAATALPLPKTPEAAILAAQSTRNRDMSIESGGTSWNDRGYSRKCPRTGADGIGSIPARSSRSYSTPTACPPDAGPTTS